MRKRLLLLGPAVLACLVGFGGSAGATTFSVTAQVVFASGPCDATAGLQFSVGPVAPFTNVGVLVDYANGAHEGAAGPASVTGFFEGIFSSSGGSPLIGGTTTITAFLDADLNLQPDAGSPIVTTTVTYCPPPLAADECKKGGFENFPNLAFKNQGDCVSFIETAGANPPAG